MWRQRPASEIWRIEAPYPVFGSPAIVGGRIYVGMGHGDFINTAQQVAKNLRDVLKAEKKSQQEIEEAVRDIRPVGAVWCIDIAKAEKRREGRRGLEGRGRRDGPGNARRR